MKINAKTNFVKVSSVGLLSVLIMTACSQQAEQKSSTNNNSATVVAQEKTPSVATASADASATRGFSYSAIGNEPDWAVEVHADGMLTFFTPENMDGTKLNAQRSAYAKGVEYTGTHEGKAFHLNLNGAACNDSMSDTAYDMTATFEFDGRTYKGCATEK